MEQQPDLTLASSFLAVFELLQEDGMTTAREQMGEFSSIPLEKPPALLVCVADKPYHIQVIWGGDFSFRSVNKTPTYKPTYVRINVPEHTRKITTSHQMANILVN